MRNLGLIVALWLSALLPTNSLALGLGEIEVNSFLNQPLNAEIEVISARPGEIDDLLVSLASREAFARAGLARPRYLLDLRFAVKKNEEGDEAVIIVTTKSGVKEPFLNFLIEADWSKGRVLREFTVLLDPPFFADQPVPIESTEVAAQPVEQPITEEASVTDIVEQAGVTTVVEADTSEPVASEEPVPEPIVSEPIALSEDDAAPLSEDVAEPEESSVAYAPEPAVSFVDDDDILVSKGDTLWSIASRYKDDAHSMAQVMLAFQRTNPDAFNDGNINNMKEGAILRVPDSYEFDAIGQQEAYAEVLTQNGLWDEYVARVTGVSPAVAGEDVGAEMSAAEQETTEAAQEGGELSLLLPGEGDSESTGTGDTGDVDELRTKLALAEEELEASRIENQELQSRISELQARLSKVEELQKMVEIEDDSLAQMQADQIEQAEQEATEGIEEIETEAADAVGDAIQADEEALLEELLAEEAAAQAEEQAATEGKADDEMVSDELVSEEAATEPAMADDGFTDQAAIEDAMAEDEAVTPPPAPVIVTEPVTRAPSVFDGILPPEIIDMIPSMGGLLGDPIILAAIGGVVVLLLILVVLKRRKGGSDDESGITVSGDDDLFAGEDEEELTPIHLADGVEPAAETDINLPSEEDSIVEEPTIEKSAAAPDEDLSATAVVSPTEMPEPEAPAPAAGSDQDDVLNEVDVYLAYGLYDNAEELLNSNLVENPERPDYRSKLLDTYFATKNTDSFVKEAEKLKSMGDAAAGYWDRVQIMGYELAPDNPLFSDAKDSDLSAADLEITKPQEADFDLGASEDDDTNFSTTDFNLGEEDTGGDFSDTANMGEAGDIAATQQIPQLDELPELSDEDDTNLRTEAAAAGDDTGFELPDDIGDELEFSMDDSAAGGSDATGVIELPDDLDLDAADAAEKVDMDEMAMEFDIDAEEAAVVDDASEVDIGAEFDAALEEADDLDLDNSEMAAFEENVVGGGESDTAIDEDAVELGIPDEEEADYAPTSIVTPNYEDTEVVPDLAPGDDEDASEIDLGMEDTAMMAADETSLATSELNLDTGELKLPTDEEIDDDEDISIIDFGGEDFVEPTDVIESFEGDGETAALDVDAEDVKTGTFAPGDFEEPTAAIDSLNDIDDIGDLMLPDDVDEVSTKLDLARAFIDMGDTEGARGSLEEVLSEGNEEQKAEAKALLDQI